MSDMEQKEEKLGNIPEQHIEYKAEGDIENLAKRYGWNPEGEKSAEDFIEFALKEVPERGKELKKYKRTVDELKVHMQKQQEYAYKQAKEELEAQKRLAHDNNDAVAYHQLEQQEKQLQPVSAEILAAQEEFYDRNSDWNDIENLDTLEIRDWAAKRDFEIGRMGLSPKEHLERLEKEVRKKFSAYFGEPSKSRPQAVESDSYNSVAPDKSSKKITSVRQLPKAFQETCANYVAAGIMTEAKYLEDLRRFGEIK